MSVRAKPSAVERGENSRLPAQFGVMNGGVRLVPIDVKRAAGLELHDRKAVKVVVIAAAHYRSFAVIRHDER